MWHQFWEGFRSHTSYYSASYQAVGAISTALAVIISLLVAFHTWRATKANIRCEASISIEEGNEKPKATIINQGAVPAIFHYNFWWILPFSSVPHLTKSPFEAAFDNQSVKFPITLKPYEKIELYLGRLESLDVIAKAIPNNIIWYFRLMNVRLVIYSATGEAFYARIYPGLKQRIRSHIEKNRQLLGMNDSEEH